MLKFRWKDLSHENKSEIMYLENYYLENIYNSDDLLTFLVILKNCKVVAYLSYKEYVSSYDIYNVGVAKDYRRKGLATMLFDSLVGKDIYLEVSEDNYGAIKLYEKLGFISISEIKNYYKDNKIAYVMFKASQSH